jgi:PhnB protein
MTVSPVPPGYHSVTPYLIVNDANRALSWYANAFGAREVMRLSAPDGRIGHAEIDIGGGRVMLADENPDIGAHGPGAYGGSPISLHLYVTDVDATVKKAAAARRDGQEPG